jgi:hypothetical protein
MLSTKTRTIVIALVAASSFAATSVVPAVSQARFKDHQGGWSLGGPIVRTVGIAQASPEGLPPVRSIAVAPARATAP